MPFRTPQKIRMNGPIEKLQTLNTTMKISFIYLLFFLYTVPCFSLGHMKSIQEFGVLPQNGPATNALNLQKAIDWASDRGAALFVQPSSHPYRVSSGIILKNNVSLIGVHGPTPRGTYNPSGKAPVGSAFAIMDAKHPFITVESATQIKGIQFWYPHQELNAPDKIIPYPPTIQVSKISSTEGVTLSALTFYGEYIAMDFNADPKFPCELILIKHCYGYPLSGQFIRINYCYDIPRFLHCHVNPSNMRLMGLHFSKAVIDAVIAHKTYAYSVDHTDNAVLMDLFSFATYGGIYLGAESYGQLTNFNLDCVTIGIYKTGANYKNRNWQIAQGSIIANAGTAVNEIHPLVITGKGHTSIVNVEAFSGDNAVLTNAKKSYDYMLVSGNEKLTISLFGCRMRNYVADHPITLRNPQAVIQAVACIDKDLKLYNETIGAQ